MVKLSKALDIGNNKVDIIIGKSVPISRLNGKIKVLICGGEAFLYAMNKYSRAMISLIVTARQASEPRIIGEALIKKQSASPTVSFITCSII